ncbi:hypothetical protein [Mesorhizobium australicum]|uniref:ParG n=1 Tax=Mesorhizobium australicum TaxID=536018 RepID=A0A1X7MPX2_9HYPH|nr:hypothetical protein [Mesorhizobium australicum]SMH26067.1 hypothetical protein SAMN02982922_0007 [Mesorhizobium australicum]SMH26086.1 hypothetical protein SAMN02982922_0019 [Mesorhizobium australicum]
MSKKNFAAAPKPAALSAEQEAYISKGRGKDTAPANNEPTARLSVDLPRSMHKRFKIACEQADTKMVTELLAFIERRTTELESRKP